MDKLMLRKLGMLERVSDHFEDREDLYAAYGPLKAEISTYQSVLAQLRELTPDPARQRSGRHTARRQALQQWVADLVPLSRKALVWARRNNRPDLEPVFDLHESDFMKVPEQLAARKGHACVADLLQVIASLPDYNVGEAEVQAVAAGIRAFEDMKPAAELAEGARQSAGQQLTTLMKQLDDILSAADDLIDAEFGRSHPAVVLQYHLSREIGARPSRHTGLRISATTPATGLPVEGLKVVIRELEKSALTDIHGLGEIIRVKPGGYHVDYVKDGVVVRTEVVDFARGVVVERIVEL